MKIAHQIFMRWRRLYPEGQEARHLRPTVIAEEVHPQHRTGFLVTCGSRGDAREDLEVGTKCLRRRRNLERNFRCMYYPSRIFYWFDHEAILRACHRRSSLVFRLCLAGRQLTMKVKFPGRPSSQCIYRCKIEYLVRGVLSIVQTLSPRHGQGQHGKKSAISCGSCRTRQYSS